MRRITAWGRLGAGAAAVAVLLCAGAARADVTVERTMRSAGIAGIGGGDSTTVEKFSGQRKREVSTMKMTGFLGKMAGDLGGDTITDVPKDAIWKLDHKKKTYTESKITPPPKKEEKPGKSEDRSKRDEKDEEEKEEKPTHRVVRNEITVTEPGDDKKIGAYHCKHYVITWILETENLETLERTESTMVSDLWNTAETDEIKALQKEEREFTQALLKKQGWDMTDQQAQKLGLAMVGALLGGSTESQRQGAKEIAEKMEKIKGYSIGSGVKWMVKSTGGTAKQGGGEAGGMPDLSKGLGGLMSAFGKKAAKGAGESAAGGGGDGAKTVFDTYTEIRSISTSSLPAADFAPPGDYKKVN